MANVIPGGTSLGLGFNLFGDPDDMAARRRLFDMGQISGEWRLNGEIYGMPANALHTELLKESGVITAQTYYSAKDFEERFEAGVKVAGKPKAFKVSVSAKYAKLCKGKSSALLVEVRNFSPVYQLSLKARRQDMLAPEVLSDDLYKNLPETFSVDTREAFFAFFRRYGSHYISRVTLGGELIYYCLADQSYSQDSHKLEAQATAEYNAVFEASGEVDWAKVDQTWSKHREVTIETKPAGSLSLKSPKFGDDLSDDEGYKRWLNDSQVHPAIIEFELEPIAEIFPQKMRSAFILAEEAFSESYIHLENSLRGRSQWPGNIILRGTPLKPQNPDTTGHVRQVVIDRRNLEVKLDKVYGWSEGGLHANGGDMYEDILRYNDSNYILVVTTFVHIPMKTRLCVATDWVPKQGVLAVSEHQRHYFEVLRNQGADDELEKYLKKETGYPGDNLASYLFVGILGRRSEMSREKTEFAYKAPPPLSSFDVFLEPHAVDGEHTLYSLIFT